MAAVADTSGEAASPARGAWALDRDRLGALAEAVAIPLIALLAGAALFALFMLATGHDPIEVYALIWHGGFGSSFSWSNTLLRAAPLLLTALCTAVPARLGLVVIGNEGALVLGGVAAAGTGLALAGAPDGIAIVAMGLAGMLVGGTWVALAGALRHFRGVNETISSLLLSYLAIALMNHLVEGPLRDPASLNKPSTGHIGDGFMLGALPGTDIHVGLAIGIVVCLICHVLIRHTRTGFAMRVVGGNPAAARLAGLSVGPLLIGACCLGGAAAGLAGMIEVAAVHGRANASLAVGYGYTGILVAFLARHNALAIVPVAILLGGIGASSGLLQRRMDLPDASVLVLQGLLFVAILASEALRGRLRPYFSGAR